MKAALVVLSLSVAVAGTARPEYEWDPATVKSCVEWYNNGIGETCEFVRNYFSITPEEFAAWNPSVGLDCKPWRFQSYCIVTRERLENSAKTKTTTTSIALPTSTSISSTLRPSPTAWEPLGCYFQGNTPLILENHMTSEGGDGALTIPKCQDVCYHKGLRFAGVEGGNQCWCSSYVGGEFAPDPAECNLPCSGDGKTVCGGKSRLNIFRAGEPGEDFDLPTNTFPKSSSLQVSSLSPTPSQSKSGASKNLAFFL